MKSNKEILKYVVPGIVGLLFNSLYIIIDGIFVSKILGSNSLAAVTIVVPIVEILIALSLMISIGCGTYISLTKGKNDKEEARNYFNHGLLLTVGMSMVIMLIFLLFNKGIVKALGATDLIIEETRSYFIWFTLFIPFFMMNYSLGTWIRNDGKPELAMLGQVIGAILNIALDYIFMAKFHMGIKGAAIATGLGPVFGIIILLPHFLGKKGDLYLEKIKISTNKLKNIVVAGIPSFAIEFSLGIMTFLCNLFLSYRFQELGLATFGIIGYINLIILSVYLGIGQGTQPLVSLYQGQNRYEEINDIYKFSLKISVGLGVFSYILVYLFGNQIVNIFLNDADAEFINFSIKAMSIFFIGVPLTGVNIITASIFEAKQVIVPSLVISLLRSFVFLLPVLLVLNLFENPMLLWVGVSITEFLTLFVSGKLWKHNKNIELKY